VAFSVDGAQKEIFEYYRRGANFEQVEANIERLLSMRINNKPSVIFNMVSHRETDPEIFINRWKGKVDVLTLSRKRQPNREDNIPIIFSKPCPLLYQQLVIGWNGITGLCCEDFWGDYITGEFPEKSLYEIWHGRALNKARQLHEKGHYKKLPLCRHCDAGELRGYAEEKRGNTLIRKELM